MADTIAARSRGVYRVVLDASGDGALTLRLQDSMRTLAPEALEPAERSTGRTGKLSVSGPLVRGPVRVAFD